jgi:hypothetical protein
MGETFGAIADDATAVYWNPAGLATVEDRCATAMHAVWFEDTSYDWFSYSQRSRGIGTVGIGIQYLSYGKLTAIDANGREGDAFTPSDLAVSFSYARMVGGYGLGCSLKYISSTILQNATAVAADLGIMRKLPGGKLSLASTLQNLGTKLTYTNGEEPLPLNVKVAAAYLLLPALTVAVDLNLPEDNDPFYSSGFEYGRVLNERFTLALRGGFTTRYKDTDSVNGFTAGFGIGFSNYSIDYAFAPYGVLGDTHRISLSLRFK